MYVQYMPGPSSLRQVRLLRAGLVCSVPGVVPAPGPCPVRHARLLSITPVPAVPAPAAPLMRLPASKCVTERSINHPLFQLVSRQILLSAAEPGN